MDNRKFIDDAGRYYEYKKQEGIYRQCDVCRQMIIMDIKTDKDTVDKVKCPHGCNGKMVNWPEKPIKIVNTLVVPPKPKVSK